MQNVKEIIAKNLVSLRKARKLTQQDLAEKLNYSDKAVSKWENGRSMMDISMLKPLSECLGVSVVEIINGERMDDKDKILKSDDVVLKTVDYADSKIKRIIFFPVFTNDMILDKSSKFLTKPSDVKYCVA